MRVDFAGKGQISFEGRALPDAVKILASALSFEHQLSPGAHEWLMDLRYCWGRSRRLSSRRVRRYVTEVLSRLENDKEAAAKHLCGLYPELEPSESVDVVNEWTGALQTILDSTRTTTDCSWSMPVTDDEVEQNIRLALAFAGKDPRNSQFALVQNAPAGLERRLRSMERKDLLAFLASLADAMSDRVSLKERLLFRFKNLL